MNAREFLLDGFPNLENVTIFSSCFLIGKEQRDDGLFQITNCPSIRYLEIDYESFRDFKTMKLTNLSFLRSIRFGSYCFEYAREFILDDFPSLEIVKIDSDCFRNIDSNIDDALFRITNCPNLRQVEIDSDSFVFFKSFELSNVNSLQSIKFGHCCFRYADFSLKGE